MFRITKTDKNFARMNFVVSVVPKRYTESQYSLDLIKVDSARICGSDGHSLHLADNNGLIPPGYYTVIKGNKSEIILNEVEGATPDWPDFAGLLNTDDSAWRSFPVSSEPKLSDARSISKIIRALPPEITVNPAYITRALPVMATAHISDDQGDFLLLKGESVKALIMPVKMED